MKDGRSLREAIRSIIREIADSAPNVSTSDALENLRRYVMDNVDLQGRGEYESYPKSRYMDAVKGIFKDEKGWEISRVGLKRAFIDWLRGMPSVLDLATYYTEVRNLMYALGYDGVEGMDDEEVDKFYYEELYRVFFGS